MATYAPENIKLDVPQAPTLADWLMPEEPGQTYLGPNINWEKIPSNLLTLLTLSDPSGIAAGPAGLIWKTPVATAFASRGILGPSRLTRLSKFGDWLEQYFPRLGATTKQTPVFTFDTPSVYGNAVAGYVGKSKMRPFGAIGLGKWAQERELAHEALHRAIDVDPYTRELAYTMARRAPTQVLDDLRKLLGLRKDYKGFMSFENEFVPYLFGGKFPGPGGKIINQPMLNELEKFLQQSPSSTNTLDFILREGVK